MCRSMCSVFMSFYVWWLTCIHRIHSILLAHSRPPVLPCLDILRMSIAWDIRQSTPNHPYSQLTNQSFLGNSSATEFLEMPASYVPPVHTLPLTRAFNAVHWDFLRDSNTQNEIATFVSVTLDPILCQFLATIY